MFSSVFLNNVDDIYDENNPMESDEMTGFNETFLLIILFD